MLEIFALIAMSARIAQIARSKGLSQALYVTLLILFWIAGEVAAIATMDGLDMTRGYSAGAELMMMVVMGFGGGAIGALCAFGLVKRARARFDDPELAELAELMS